MAANNVRPDQIKGPDEMPTVSSLFAKVPVYW